VSVSAVSSGTVTTVIVSVLPLPNRTITWVPSGRTSSDDGLTLPASTSLISRIRADSRARSSASSSRFTRSPRSSTPSVSDSASSRSWCRTRSPASSCSRRCRVCALSPDRLGPRSSFTPGPPFPLSRRYLKQDGAVQPARGGTVRQRPKARVRVRDEDVSPLSVTLPSWALRNRRAACDSAMGPAQADACCLIGVSFTAQGSHNGLSCYDRSSPS
jgi:hypothetical protein